MSIECQTLMFHEFCMLFLIYLHTYVKSMDCHTLKLDGHISIDAYFEIHNVFQLSALASTIAGHTIIIKQSLND